MTDTDAIGKIVTEDGGLHQIMQTITDGTPETLKIFDLGGNEKEIYQYLLGRIIKRIEIQVSDGSILDYIQVTQNGAETHYMECGERIHTTANPIRSNLEINVHIPITDSTRINIDTAD